VGVVASLFGIYMVIGGDDAIKLPAFLTSRIDKHVHKIDENASLEDLLHALRRSVWGASVVILGLSLAAVILTGVSFNYWLVILVGLVAGNGTLPTRKNPCSRSPNPARPAPRPPSFRALPWA
jgi:K(+)-stimulated pyrophosphate-energized sodium pump